MKVSCLIALCLCLMLPVVIGQYVYPGQAYGQRYGQRYGQGYVNPYYGANGGYVDQGNGIYDGYDARYGSGNRRDTDRKRRLRGGSRRGGSDRSQDSRRRYF